MKGKEAVDSITLPVLTKIKVKDTDECIEDTSPSTKKKYIRKFQSKWLRDSRFSSWLIPCEDNETDAFCTLCNRKISGSVTLLERHRRTKKHKKKLMNHDPLAAHNVFPQFFAKKEKKTSEDDDDGMKGNYGGDDYELERTVNLPGEDHNAYIISSSMRPSSSDKKNGRFFKDSIEAANFIQQTINSKHLEEDEFDHFGRSIASQLRKLPEESAVSLISDLQCMVTQRRLKVIADRESQTPSITSQVLTVDFETNQPFAT